MEVLLAAFVLLALFLLEEERMGQVAGWLRDFMEYLERQQG